MSNDPRTAVTIDASPPPVERTGVIAETATTFTIACLLTAGWIGLIAALPPGMIRDTFDGAYQHLTVFLLFWHLTILGFRTWRVYRPERAALDQDWFTGGGRIDAAAMARIASAASAYEAAHGHSIITRRLILAEAHLASHGGAGELSSLLERRAEADRGRTEDAYALPRFLFWAIPILGFIGTVVGIGGAIAGLKTGDITSAEHLKEQIGHVAGSLGTAFYATQVALILSVIALLAQTMLYQGEARLHDRAEDLLTYQLENRLVVIQADQASLVAAIQAHARAIAEDASARDQASRTHIQALISGHEQMARSLEQIAAAAATAGTAAAAATAAAEKSQRTLAEQGGALAGAITTALGSNAGVARAELERLGAAMTKILTEDRAAATQAAAAQAAAARGELEKATAALARALSDDRERAAKAAQEERDRLAKVLADREAQSAAVLAKSGAQVDAAVAALAALRQDEAGRGQRQAQSLEQTLAGVQEALRQLPPAIQQLRKPVQVQLAIAQQAGGPG